MNSLQYSIFPGVKLAWHFGCQSAQRDDSNFVGSSRASFLSPLPTTNLSLGMVPLETAIARIRGREEK